MKILRLQLHHISNPLYGEDGLKMTLPPNKWKYLGLEFCLDL